MLVTSNGKSLSNRAFHACRGRSGYWWLKKGNEFHQFTRNMRGDQEFSMELDLAPGMWTLGCGRGSNRIRVNFGVNANENSAMPEEAPPVVENTTPKIEQSSPEPSPAPKPAPIDTAPQYHSESVAAGVNTKVLANQSADDAALENLGISVDNLYYNKGTAFIKLGYDMVRDRRSQVDNNPGPEAAAAIADQIDAEQRGYHILNANSIKPRTDGTIEWKDSDGHSHLARPNGAGWSGILGPMLREQGTKEPLFRGAALYLMSRPPKQRAWNVTADLRSVDPRRLVFHTRNAPNGERQLYHVSSTATKHFGGGRFARQIAGLLPDDAKVEATYDPASTKVRIDARWAADGSERMGAGSITEVGMSFHTSDLGDSSYKGWFTAYWSRCLNAILIGEGRKPLFRKTHKASVNALRYAIRDGMRKGNTVASHFRHKWGYLGEITMEQFIEERADKNTMSALEMMSELRDEDLAVARVQEAMRLVLNDRKLANLLSSKNQEKVLIPAVVRGARLEHQAGFLTGTSQDLVQSITRTHEFAPVRLADSFELLAGQLVG